MKKLLISAACVIVNVAACYADVNVYASALSCNGSTIQFILNADAKDVNVNLLQDGTVVDTVKLGACTKGLNTFNLSDYGVSAGTYNWSVTASADAIAEGTQHTDATDANLQVSNTRGIAVDKNPASPFFGNIYMTSAGGTRPGERVATGVYAFKADLSVINQEAYTGQIEWAGNSSPNNLKVADDGNVFICDWTDGHGGVYILNPAAPDELYQSAFAEGETASSGLVTVDGVKLHGSVQDCAIFGEGESRMLYTSDEDYVGNNGEILAYQMGTLSTPIATAPADWGTCDGKLANGNQRLDSDRRGGLWVSQYRWQESDAYPCLMHLNAAGVWDFTTGDKSVFLGSGPAGAMGVNADGSLIAIADSGNGKTITVAKATYDENGLPTLEPFSKITYANYGTRPMALSFDAADNIYVAFNNDNAEGGMGVFALPKENNEYTTPANDQVTFTTGILNLNATSAKLTLNGNIVSAGGQIVEVYSVAGAKVAQGTQVDMSNFKGIFIARSGEKAIKINR
jgi:hypothetical protein